MVSERFQLCDLDKLHDEALADVRKRAVKAFKDVVPRLHVRIAEAVKHATETGEPITISVSLEELERLQRYGVLEAPNG